MDALRSANCSLGEITLIFWADKLGPSGGQELCVQVVLKPVAAEGIAVVDLDEQRAAVAGYAEIGGVAGGGRWRSP